MPLIYVSLFVSISYCFDYHSLEMYSEVKRTSMVNQTVKNLQCRRLGFNSRIGKVPWRRKWQPTPVFLPKESQGQRRLAGYMQSMWLQRAGHD